jgi:hypothetical protein
MAFGVKVGGTYLDLFPESQISFEKNTELWVTGDPTIQLGSYSFPFDLPLTDNNRYLLRFPDRIDAYTDLVAIEDVVLYAGKGLSIGLPLFTGRLFVKNATNERVSVFIVVEGLSRQNEKKFEDVDMGVFNIGGPVSLESLMNGTIAFPLLNDFVFFPVWNETLRNTYVGTPNIEWFSGNVFGASRMNHHTDEFVYFFETDTQKKNNSILVPFLRLELILERIAEGMGYTMINEWMDGNDELRSICLFNNKSINDLDTGHKFKIRYNEHVPTKMLMTDFLKAVCKYAFVGIFADHASKTILLRPYKTILLTPPRHDWTDRMVEDYEIEQDNTIPSQIGFATDDTDEYFSNNWVSNIPLLADGAIIADYYEPGGNPNSHGLIDGYYNVYRDNTVMRYDPSKTTLAERWRKWSHRFDSINIGGRGEPWLSKCIPMWSDSGNPVFSADPFMYSIPRADIPLNINLKVDDGEVINHTAELSSIRLMIYRGMRTMVGALAYSYPYANATAYDPATETESFDHSLHYDGDKGLYNMYGKEWMYFIKNKKIVKRYLKLTVADILNHKEYDKVRIGNMNYFVKSMKVNVTANGLGLTECELVTIPMS